MRTAVVTGAGRGVGSAIAEKLSSRGDFVVLAGRDVEALERTAASLPGESLVVRTDVTRTSDVDALIERAVDATGRLDVMVANSGIAGPTASVEEVTDEAWAAVLDVNITGVFRSCRAAVPALRRSGGGSIVVVGSMSGKKPLPHRLPYVASKTALIGLVRGLAAELGPSGIRVNLVSPGPVAGSRLRGVISNEAARAGRAEREVEADLLRDVALGRFVESAEVADAVCFLASDASACTGEDLNVSGGATIY